MYTWHMICYTTNTSHHQGIGCQWQYLFPLSFWIYIYIYIWHCIFEVWIFNNWLLMWLQYSSIFPYIFCNFLKVRFWRFRSLLSWLQSKVEWLGWGPVVHHTTSYKCKKDKWDNIVLTITGFCNSALCPINKSDIIGIIPIHLLKNQFLRSF